MLLAKDLLLASGGGDFPTDPVRFDYTGAVQTYTVPKGCTKIHVDAVGAASVTNTLGGRVECDLSVESEQTYYIYVGQKGAHFTGGKYTMKLFNGFEVYNEASSSNINSGGGATDIRTIQASAGSWFLSGHSSWPSDSSLLSRLVVAGSAGLGGLGGGLIGGAVSNSADYISATGGTQTAGGRGTYNGSDKGDANSGTFGPGAKTMVGVYAGAGWWGGGSSWNNAQIGAGGSSYTHPTLCSNVVHTQGYSGANGNGYLIITPLRS